MSQKMHSFIVIILILLFIFVTAMGMNLAHCNIKKMCTFFNDEELFSVDIDDNKVDITVFNQRYSTDVPAFIGEITSLPDLTE